MSKLVLVPAEPTQPMCNKGSSALSSWIAPAMHSDDAYRAMLAARPPIPKEEVEGLARALCKRAGYNPDTECLSSTPHWTIWRPCAIAIFSHFDEKVE